MRSESLMDQDQNKPFSGRLKKRCLYFFSALGSLCFGLFLFLHLMMEALNHGYPMALRLLEKVTGSHWTFEKDSGVVRLKSKDEWFQQIGSWFCAIQEIQIEWKTSSLTWHRFDLLSLSFNQAKITWQAPSQKSRIAQWVSPIFLSFVPQTHLASVRGSLTWTLEDGACITLPEFEMENLFLDWKKQIIELENVHAKGPLSWTEVYRSKSEWRAHEPLNQALTWVQDKKDLMEKFKNFEFRCKKAELPVKLPNSIFRALELSGVVIPIEGVLNVQGGHWDKGKLSLASSNFDLQSEKLEMDGVWDLFGRESTHFKMNHQSQNQQGLWESLAWIDLCSDEAHQDKFQIKSEIKAIGHVAKVTQSLAWRFHWDRLRLESQEMDLRSGFLRLIFLKDEDELVLEIKGRYQKRKDQALWGHQFELSTPKPFACSLHHALGQVLFQSTFLIETQLNIAYELENPQKISLDGAFTFLEGELELTSLFQKKRLFFLLSKDQELIEGERSKPKQQPLALPLLDPSFIEINHLSLSFAESALLTLQGRPIELQGQLFLKGQLSPKKLQASGFLKGVPSSIFLHSEAEKSNAAWLPIELEELWFESEGLVQTALFSIKIRAKESIRGKKLRLESMKISGQVGQASRLQLKFRGESDFVDLPLSFSSGGPADGWRLTFDRLGEEIFGLGFDFFFGHVRNFFRKHLIFPQELERNLQIFFSAYLPEPKVSLLQCSMQELIFYIEIASLSWERLSLLFGFNQSLSQPLLEQEQEGGFYLKGICTLHPQWYLNFSLYPDAQCELNAQLEWGI